MILNTQDMLDAASRCDEWDDDRITEFMTTPPYTNTGEKSIRNFIDSVGVCNITYDEIFWVIINNYLTKYDRMCICIDYLHKFSIKLGENFYPYISIIKSIVDTYDEQDNEFDIKSIITDMEFCMADIIQNFGDVNSTYKLFRLTKSLLDNLLNDTDMTLITKKICDVLIYEFSEDYNYNIILNEIQEMCE